MIVHVTELDLYRSFRDDEEFPLEVFLSQLRGEKKTPAMERGIAFAKAMERIPLGETSTVSANGHTFAFTCDAVIESWPRREERREKDYGGITVTARCDRIMGRTIADDKTTAKFDAEGYMERFQWRYYLDIFDADVFKWHVWEVKELEFEAKNAEEWGKHGWEVYAHHALTQYRYRQMEDDCKRLALEFAEFAERVGWKGSVRKD